MKTMYREEFSTRKLPIVLEILLLMVLMIFASDFAKRNIAGNKIISLLISTAAFFVIIIFTTVSVLRCRYKLRYSVIADQLIIHKVCGKEQVVEQNIKIKDIASIKKIDLLDYLIKRKKNESYLFSIPVGQTYCCSYKHENKYKTFFFQPSTSLINRLNEAIHNENDRRVS